jgi:hypothetical protein
MDILAIVVKILLKGAVIAAFVGIVFVVYVMTEKE